MVLSTCWVRLRRFWRRMRPLPLLFGSGVLLVCILHQSSTVDVDVGGRSLGSGYGGLDTNGVYRNETKTIYENASNFLANERTYLAWIRTVNGISGVDR